MNLLRRCTGMLAIAASTVLFASADDRCRIRRWTVERVLPEAQRQESRVRPDYHGL